MIQRSHLEIITALEEAGSLTAAAEKLNLTQSALTHSIKKLELLVGTELWIKEGRQLRLTQSGKLLLDSASILLPQMRRLDEQLISLGEGKMGKLTIGVECHPCFEWLVKIINNYLRDWPKIDLDVTRNFQFDGLHALLNHQVDMIVSPDYLQGEGILHYDILDFELQLMVNENSLLAQKQSIQAGDLSDEVLYTYPIDKSRLDIFSLPINPRKHIAVEATEIMVQLVAAGRGVSPFPHWLIDKYSREFPVKGISVTDKGIAKQLYLIIREQDLDIPYIQGFIQASQEFKKKGLSQ